MSKTITIAVRVNVGLQVIAERDVNGEVDIVSVLGVLGLPTPSDIYESMDDNDFLELDKQFDSA